jgi:hypothetical protein
MTIAGYWFKAGVMPPAVVALLSLAYAGISPSDRAACEGQNIWSMPFMNGMACALEDVSRFAWNVLGSHLVGVWSGAPTFGDIIEVAVFGVLACGWAAFNYAIVRALPP